MLLQIQWLIIGKLQSSPYKRIEQFLWVKLRGKLVNLDSAMPTG